MQEIQLSNEQDTELLSMTRQFTQADLDAFNQAYVELDKKGFVLSGENLMIMLRAYNQSPQAPISVKSILEYTKQNRNAFEWLSAAEIEYNKLSAEIGPETTQLVIKELGRHGLVNTPNSQDMFTNFSSVVRYYQSQHWSITADSFERAIGNLRTSLGHGRLIYKPTPSQQAAAKRWEDTRNSEPNTEYKNFTKSKKSALQVAQEKAASVAHIMNPDGTRMSDQIMREFYENHPEALEPETPAQNTPPVDPDEAFYHKQTKDYIRSIASNLIRAEAEKEYGHQHNASWKVTYSLLRNWYEKRAPGAPQR